MPIGISRNKWHTSDPHCGVALLLCMHVSVDADATIHSRVEASEPLVVCYLLHGNTQHAALRNNESLLRTCGFSMRDDRAALEPKPCRDMQLYDRLQLRNTTLLPTCLGTDQHVQTVGMNETVGDRQCCSRSKRRRHCRTVCRHHA